MKEDLRQYLLTCKYKLCKGLLKPTYIVPVTCWMRYILNQSVLINMNQHPNYMRVLKRLNKDCTQNTSVEEVSFSCYWNSAEIEMLKIGLNCRYEAHFSEMKSPSLQVDGATSAARKGTPCKTRLNPSGMSPIELVKQQIAGWRFLKSFAEASSGNI